MACSAAVPSQIQAVNGVAASRIAASESASVRGLQALPSRASCRSAAANGRGLHVVAMAGKKKVLTNLDDWKREFIGYGIFVEDSESKPVNIIKTLEKKKLLSAVEKGGLLSKLEQSGLSLSKIEKLGLLSKAEKLGLLSLAETVVTTPPGVFASAALPLIVGAVVVPLVIPDDNVALVVAQYALAAGLGLAGLASFGTSIILGILLE